MCSAGRGGERFWRGRSGFDARSSVEGSDRAAVVGAVVADGAVLADGDGRVTGDCDGGDSVRTGITNAPTRMTSTIAARPTACHVRIPISAARRLPAGRRFVRRPAHRVAT